MDLSESAISRSREENLNKLILDEYNKPYESRTVDKDDNESGNLDIENLMTEPTASFVGFMTASRKALPPVSTKGLKFANQLLNLGDEAISFGNGGGGGFMTASKKALPPVSLEIMQKVDRLFADENIEQIEDSTGLDEVSVGRGFMTASRKKLPPVSKADLDSARRVLKVTEEITNNMANEFRGGGFMTASKKSLPPVSLENQASAAKLFENEAIDIVPKFGFATAFKKPMAPPSSSNIEFAKSLMSSAQLANIERQSSSEPGTYLLTETTPVTLC
ncbi:hypothetical protein BCR33DRAFT_743863 [Rhizoclosmatium globosum]|uniref:Uncharacterized protein n=1 Tax=Rhizoclosmatium globosum TaxID=329046 RepID=A0A1Y2BEH8_9FUNG|nr:hypothetical protein BCR33DRAFT_743863 [Rhizoclosmatium globosum]|eukprot:ORY33243.1 hypothetical protein BCR33DRAFT_743863 [Rhizoclosmatium globosum]